MAPGRKRGANKAKANRELSLGDLVLAKVKGFPPWPAKVQSSLYFILFSFFLFHFNTLLRLCVCGVLQFGKCVLLSQEVIAS